MKRHSGRGIDGDIALIVALFAGIVMRYLTASEVRGLYGRLNQIGLRALELGNNVVIDYGLWNRNERSALRQAAANLGAMVGMGYSTRSSRAARTT